MAYVPKTAALAPWQPALASRGATALSGVAQTCARLRVMGEEQAWHLINAMLSMALANGAKPDELCVQLNAAVDCRSWQKYAKEVVQLKQRHACSEMPSSSRPPSRQASFAGRPGMPPSGGSSGSNSKPSTPPGNGCGGNCGCGPCNGKKEASMNGSMFAPTPTPVDWSSSCGGYRQPDPSNQGIEIASACEVAACQGGSRIGLEMMPFLVTLVPGVPNTITLGFSRPSRLVALTFTRRQLPTAASAYNPDDITISQWRTDKTLQAYDIPRQQTTFAGQDLNATAPISLINYFEDGDNSFSPIVHGMNPIPRFIPPNDIGTNDGLAQFVLTLDAAVAGNQAVFFWGWVLFTGKR